MRVTPPSLAAKRLASTEPGATRQRLAHVGGESLKRGLVASADAHRREFIRQRGGASCCAHASATRFNRLRGLGGVLSPAVVCPRPAPNVCFNRQRGGASCCAHASAARFNRQRGGVLSPCGATLHLCRRMAPPTFPTPLDSSKTSSYTLLTRSENGCCEVCWNGMTRQCVDHRRAIPPRPGVSRNGAGGILSLETPSSW